MRKHFLLLFLMALLPLAGWAADAVDPEEVPNLEYTGAAQALVIEGVAEGYTYYYATVDRGAAEPELAAYGTFNDKAKKTNAGDYDVYYVKKLGDGDLAEADLAGKVKVEASMAPAELEDITVHIGDGGAIESTTYTGEEIVTKLKIGEAELTQDDHYFITWSATMKNAGGYTATVQLKDESNTYINKVATVTFTVLPATLYVNAKNTTVTYGDAPLEVKDLYTTTGWLGDDETDANLANLAVTVTWTAGAYPTQAGDYTFTIAQGTVQNYNVHPQVPNATLTVAKTTLTITAASFTDDDAIVFGDPIPFAATYEGLLDDDKDENGAPVDGILNGTVAYILNTENLEVGEFTITPKVVDGEGTELPNVATELLPAAADNYAIVAVAGDLKVVAKALDADDILIADIAPKQYTGTNLKDAVEASLSLKHGETDLVLGTDYTVTWTYTNGTADPAATTTLKDVYTKYTATFTGIGNYAGDVEAAPTKDFVITKAPLTIIIATDLTKVYDGAEFGFPVTGVADPSAAQKLAAYADIYGAKNEEALTTIFQTVPVLSYAKINNSKVNVNDYVVTATTGVSQNYDVVVEDGALSITPMPIYLKADPISQVYGKAEKTLTYKVYSNATLTTALSASIESGKKDNTYMKTAATLTREAGTNFGEYAISFTSYGAANSNYEIKEATAEDGDFYSITKAQLRFLAENKTVEYDGVAPIQSPNNAASTKNLTWRVIGLITGDEVTTAPTLSIVDAEGEPNDGIDYVAGGYTIKIEGGAVNNPQNYDTEVTHQNGTYTITKKALTVTAKQQGMIVGETEADIDQTAYTFGDGIIAGDETKIQLSIVFATVTQAVDETHPYATTEVQLEPGGDDPDYISGDNIEAPATSATLVGGLVFDADATTGAKAGNYTFTYVPGNLLLTDGTEDLDLVLTTTRTEWEAMAAEDKPNVATIEAAAGKKVNVKFDGYTLIAEKWYPMVLPFATTVKELSAKFGYAVVNILNKENTDDAIRFKLHMQAIEANQPFLIKIADNKQIGDNDDPDDDVVFTNKTVVNNDNNEDVNPNTNIKITGVYGGKQGVTKDDFWFTDLEGYDNYYGGKANATRYLRPMNAFITRPDGSTAKAIYLQDLDGTITAIQAITADGAEAIAVEGWYTVDGIKLQGIPTEKGIYINNGKKIVVK